MMVQNYDRTFFNVTIYDGAIYDGTIDYVTIYDGKVYDATLLRLNS